ETAVGEEPPDPGNEARPEPHRLAAVLVAHEIQIALAIADLDVAHAMVFFGRTAQRLGDDLQLFAVKRHLAALGLAKLPRRRDEVAKIDIAQGGDGRGALFLDVELE